MKPGHKIGKPSTLFVKIEQDRLTELKMRYGGSQSNDVTAEMKSEDTQNKIENTKTFEKTELEAAIAHQAEKVRKLKSSVDRSVWQPELNKLLSLKQELKENEA